MSGSRVDDPARLEALAATGLLDSPREPEFDRFTRLAARLLKVPVALISLVDDRRQFFKAATGLSEPWATKRETPLSHSFCQHVVRDGTSFVVTDARDDERVRDNLAIQDLGVAAYAGVALASREGLPLGAFCAIDVVPKKWSDEELALLREIADCVEIEVEARRRTYELEGRLTQKRADLDALFDNLPIGLVLFDRDIRYRRINRSLAAMNGLPVEAHLGKTVKEALPGLPDALDKQLREVLESGVPALDQLVATPTPATGNEPHIYRLSFFPVRSEDAEIVGIGGAVVDVTELEHAEQERRRLATMLDAILANAPIMLTVIDAEGRMLLVNHGAAQAVGRRPPELEGKRLVDVLPADRAAKVLADYDLARKLGGYFSLETEVLHEGKLQRFATTRFALAPEAGFGDAVVSISTDVTEASLGRERMDALARIGAAFVGARDEETLPELLAQILVPKHADWCSVFMRDEDGSMRLCHQRHADNDLERMVDEMHEKFPLEADAPSGYPHVFRTGEAIVLPEIPEGLVSSMARSPEHLALLERLDLGSAIAVPVMLGDRVVAVLELMRQRQSGRSYGNDDLPFAREVAARLSLALQNTRLLKRQADDAETLRRANDELEHRVAERTAELRQTVRDKEVLLQEVHHRVKNNLQTMSSLLSLQLRDLSGEAAREPLLQAQMRVRAIAVAHELLYASPDLERLDLDRHLHAIVRALRSSLGTSVRGIQLEVTAERHLATIEIAVPFGLLVSELVSNALKHAFAGREAGRVEVELAGSAHRATLTVTDDGIGLPVGFEQSERRSLGLVLVEMLSGQLGGAFAIHRRDDGGTRAEVSFPITSGGVA